MEEPRQACALCGRELPSAACGERHHLVPRAKKGRDTVLVCIDCGDQLHQLFTNQELKRTYNSLAALRDEPRVQRWIAWIRRRRTFGTCMKRKKRRT